MKRFLRLLPILLLLTLIFSSCASKNEGNYESDLSSRDVGSEIKLSETASTEKLIREYSISAETQHFDKTVDGLLESMNEAGGYLGSSEVRSYSDETRHGYYVFHIPAAKVESFLAGAEGLYHVTSSSSTVENVTEAYYSTAARLEELKTERDSLLQMMEDLDQKTEYDLWLKMTERLSSIRQDIAVYQYQLDNMDSRVSYSEVTLNLTEVVVLSGGEGFGSRAKDAFVNGICDFWIGLQDFFIGLLSVLPSLVLFLLVLPACFFLVLRHFRRVKKLHEERHDKKESENNTKK